MYSSVALALLASSALSCRARQLSSQPASTLDDDHGGIPDDPHHGNSPHDGSDPPSPYSGPVLEVPKLPIIGTLAVGCGCSHDTCDFQPDPHGVRDLSNLVDGNEAQSKLYTNMVWSWGQFLDHDFVDSQEDKSLGKFELDLHITPKSAPKSPRQKGGFLGPHFKLKVGRVAAECHGQCRAPKMATTPQIDAGTVYSNYDPHRDHTLREPGSCRLRTSAGDLPPVTTNTMHSEESRRSKHFFLAGDMRVNEHSILTNMHTMWLREHNRLCDVIEKSRSHLSADEQFHLVRKIVIAKMQEITLYEWLPALGLSPHDVRHATPLDTLAHTSAISTEFFMLYRWGHDCVPDTVGDHDMTQIFDGEAFMKIAGPHGTDEPEAVNHELDRLVEATATEPMGDLDGSMSDAVRNMLFGEVGLDLVAINAFRSRDIGLPGYKALSECYGVPAKPDLPTDNGFIGAVLDNGGADKAFGPLERAVMLDQMHRVFFGAEGNWWETKYAQELVHDEDIYNHIVGTKLSNIIKANTEAQVPEDVFLLPGVHRPDLSWTVEQGRV